MSDGGILLFFIAAIAAIFYVFITESMKNEKEKQEKNKVLTAELKRAHNLEECFISREDSTFLGLSFKRQEIVLGKVGSLKSYPFKSITKIEIIKNGASVSSTNRDSQIGGAIVGGVLFGGGGALVGALTGKQTTENTIAQLILRIIMDDLERPLWDITFFKWVDSKGINPESNFVKPYIERVDHIHALLFNILRQTSHEMI